MKGRMEGDTVGSSVAGRSVGGNECVIFDHAALIQKEAESECEDCANLFLTYFLKFAALTFSQLAYASLHVPVYHRAT